MKYFLLFFLSIVCCQVKAQKYILLDQHLAEPVAYAESVTSEDNFNDLFPVEKKLLSQFIRILQEIEHSLSQKGAVAKDYDLGCIKFKGLKISLASGERTDYVVTSTCGNVKISMHLCDAKVSNANNEYFINTWIRYIKNYVK